MASRNTRMPRLSRNEMTSLLSVLPMMSEEHQTDSDMEEPHSKSRFSPGRPAGPVSSEGEMSHRSLAVGQSPQEGSTDDDGACSAMATPGEEALNHQLGIRVKKPNASMNELGVVMRKGAGAVEVSSQSSREQQQQQEPTAAAAGCADAPLSQSPVVAPEQLNCGVQPELDSSILSDDSDNEGAVFATRRGCHPVSEDSSDGDSELQRMMEALELKKLVSSSESDHGQVGLEPNSDSEVVVDLGRKPVAETLPLPMPVCAFEEEVTEDVGEGYQGLLYGTVEVLLSFVKELMYRPRNSGISVWPGLQPAVVNGALRYEEGKQFFVLQNLQPSVQRSQQGVFLCQDASSKKTFVLKKISSSDYRLPGLEFLVRHAETFLPKIYAVYKEKGMVWIFEEYIEGEIAANCDWNPNQVHQFARCLLSACQYLHLRNLAHCDLKLANVMVRDPTKPDSMVIIDFESARQKGPSIEGGQGHTPAYLPPWYKSLPSGSFSPLLMVADLWAVGCILVCLLEGSSWNSRLQQQHLQDLGIMGRRQTQVQQQQQQGGRGKRTIWGQQISELVKRCRRQAPQPEEHGSQFCPKCRAQFLIFLETEGHQILSLHLGSLMTQGVDDPHWETLLELLEYLTDCSYVHDMNAGTALSFLNDNYHLTSHY